MRGIENKEIKRMGVNNDWEDKDDEGTRETRR